MRHWRIERKGFVTKWMSKTHSSRIQTTNPRASKL
jgi:hypothetical protein